MAENIFPRHAPHPTAVLGYDGTNFYVLNVDADRHLQIDVLTSGLPLGAATAANQATLLSRVPDVLFNFHDNLRERYIDPAAGSDDHVEYSAAPSAGEVYVVTAVFAQDLTRDIDHIQMGVLQAGVHTHVARYVPTAIADPFQWTGHLYLIPGCQIYCIFQGSLINDVLHLYVHGHKMLNET